MIYNWMNMFKPVMHSFHRTAAILKLTDKHKGPSGSLRGRTEIPHTAHSLSSITTHNGKLRQSTQDAWNKKRKACQSKLIFFH